MNKALKYLILSNYIFTITFGLFHPLFALFIERIGGNEFEVGLAWFVYAFTTGVLLILFGRIEDKMSTHARKLIAASYLTLAAGSILYLFVDSPVEVYIVQIVFAVAVATLKPVTQSTIAKLEDSGKENTEWGIYDGGQMISHSFAALLGGSIVALVGFDALFVLMAVSQVIAAAIVFFMMRQFADTLGS